MTQETKEKIKLLADKEKEKTLYFLLNRDSIYMRNEKMIRLLMKEFEQLDITEEQRTVIEKILCCKEEQMMDYGSYSYIAGRYNRNKKRKWHMLFNKFNSAKAAAAK